MNITTYIKETSKDLGFASMGWINLSDTKSNDNFKQWIDNNYHGQMDYLKQSLPIRNNPINVLPTAKSAMVFTYNYYQTSNNKYISTYAQGRDYHRYLRKKLKKIGDSINTYFNLDAQFRPCVDSAPVMERQLALQAGLGWIGKNAMLINKKGSYYFIAVLLSSLEAPNHNLTIKTNHCGNCQICIHKCPTQAIIANGVIDARKCLSYLSIEFKKSIPVKLRKAFGTNIFGCDICQSVCPWNNKQPESKDINFQTKDILKNISLIELLKWDAQTFDKNTQGSPLRRMGFECFKRNIAIAIGNEGNNNPIIIKALLQAKGTSTLIDEHIDWTLKQLITL